MWGRSDRVIVTSGLSKAYGLPGLRIGWIVGPPATIASLWSYHDYTTISPGALSDVLARRALAPAQRARILARTRRHSERELSGHRAGGSTRTAICSATTGRTPARSSMSAITIRSIPTELRHAAARAEERPDRARRSFRHGWLSADRLRRRAETICARLESAQRSDCGSECGVRIYCRFNRQSIRTRNPHSADDEVRSRPDRLRQRRAAVRRAAPRAAGRLLRARIIGSRRAYRRHRRPAATAQAFIARLKLDADARVSSSSARRGGRLQRTDRIGSCSTSSAMSSDAAPRPPRERRLVVVETTTLDIAAASRRSAHVRRRARAAARTSSPPTKGPVAFAYARVSRARRDRADRRFLFEGAVMDGIPIFNLVRETLPAVDDRRVSRRREQHDQLHPHRDGAGTIVRRRRSTEMQARGHRRGRIRRSTSTAGTPRRRPPRSPTSCSARGMTPQERRARGHHDATLAARAVEARGHGPPAEAGRACRARTAAHHRARRARGTSR